jgi:hypothetical protein
LADRVAAVVVAVAVAGGVVAAAVAGADSRQLVTSEEIMKTKRFEISCLLSLSVAIMACVLCLFCIAGSAQSQPSPSQPQAKAPEVGRAFDTAQQAADALVQAAGDFNVPELLAIMGPGSEDIVASKDTVQDKNRAEGFAADARAKMSVQIDPKNPNRATVVVGLQEWPGPVPIVKRNGKWYFDTKAGRQEILYRRIGSNELDAIQVCHGYVEAQKEYAEEIHDDSGVNQYAQRIISTAGKQDGLYWRNADGSSGGPIGEEVAKAIQEGYSSGKEGYHGYYFKILKGQGPAAPMGKLNYVIEGIMIGGFALVAVPVEYRVTGVKTFIVSNDGIVYQKDLGPDSLEIVKKMEVYNPDSTWKPTYDEWPADVDAPHTQTKS